MKPRHIILAIIPVVLVIRSTITYFLHPKRVTNCDIAILASIIAALGTLVLSLLLYGIERARERFRR